MSSYDTGQRMAELIRLARRGRKAEERGKVLQGCFTSLLTVVFVWLLDAVFLMVLFGVLHAYWASVPASGYWICIIVAVCLRGLGMGRTITKPGGAS